MNTDTSPSARDREQGFTLVEILIAIVLVGILAAVAVVGISNMVGQGNKASCTATADSARAATAVYFAGHASTYPADFSELTGGPSPAMTLPSGVTISADKMSLDGGDWALTMTAGSPPTFAGCPA